MINMPLFLSLSLSLSLTLTLTHSLSLFPRSVCCGGRRFSAPYSTHDMACGRCMIHTYHHPPTHCKSLLCMYVALIGGGELGE
ncbi:hypothetical protein DFP73DRAFT_556511, partial [Morchella snyderi]